MRSEQLISKKTLVMSVVFHLLVEASMPLRFDQVLADYVSNVGVGSLAEVVDRQRAEEAGPELDR